MSDIQWTMNCVLFGAKVIKLIEEGKFEEAKKKIKNLSSEFEDDIFANYLIKRLRELIVEL